MRAAADDDDVVALLELGPRPPHAALAEDVTHRRRASSHERVVADRAAAEVAGGVRHDGPHVLAERGAEQHQVAVLGLAEDPAGRARDRAGAPVAGPA